MDDAPWLRERPIGALPGNHPVDCTRDDLVVNEHVGFGLVERLGHERRQPVIKSQQANSVYNDGRASVRYEIIFKVWYSLPMRPYQGRDRERETDRHRQRQTERQTETLTQTADRQREADRQTDTENETDRERQREKERERESSERNRETGRETDRQKDI